MELWEAVLNEGLTPTRLWLRLEPVIRVEAAESLYAHDWGEEPVKSEANAAIASALRFRELAVRKLPKAERVKYLARTVRPDGSLVSSLLLSLHLEKRTDLMSTFLDTLKIPHQAGLIEEDFEIEKPEQALLAKAVEAAVKKHDEKQVELYLLTLYMMDPSTWQGLVEIMRERLGIPAE